jgi:hypothetical protein
MRTRTIAGLAAVVSRTFTAPAMADSIAYIKAGDGWLATSRAARSTR